MTSVTLPCVVQVMEAMGNMLDVPTLAAKLMKNLFTEEERINSNTTGDHGKQVRPLRPIPVLAFTGGRNLQLVCCRI